MAGAEVQAGGQLGGCGKSRQTLWDFPPVEVNLNVYASSMLKAAQVIIK